MRWASSDVGGEETLCVIVPEEEEERRDARWKVLCRGSERRKCTVDTRIQFWTS